MIDLIDKYDVKCFIGYSVEAGEGIYFSNVVYSEGFTNRELYNTASTIESVVISDIEDDLFSNNDLIL